MWLDTDMTTTTATQIPVTITVNYDQMIGLSAPYAYHVKAIYDSEAERDAVLAQFPKNLKLRAEVLRHLDRDNQYMIYGYGKFKETKGNEFNETAQRRFARLLELIEYKGGHGCYATADEARAAVFGSEVK
jgi:hypothetical protein